MSERRDELAHSRIAETEARISALEKHRIDAPAQVVAELHKQVFAAVDARPPAPALYRIDPHFLERIEKVEQFVADWRGVMHEVQAFAAAHPTFIARLEELEQKHPELMASVRRVETAVSQSFADFGQWVEHRLSSRSSAPLEPDVHPDHAALASELDAELDAHVTPTQLASVPPPALEHGALVDDKAAFLATVEDAPMAPGGAPPRPPSVPAFELEAALDAELEPSSADAKPATTEPRVTEDPGHDATPET